MGAKANSQIGTSVTWVLAGPLLDPEPLSSSNNSQEGKININETFIAPEGVSPTVRNQFQSSFLCL